MGKNLFKAAVSTLFGLTLSITSVSAQDLAGPYLAATIANYDSDFVAAAHYYSEASKADPQNTFLKQNAIVAFVSIGDFQSAVDVANSLHEDGFTNPFADLVTMVALVKFGQNTEALEYLPAPEIGLSPLLQGLLDGWLKVGAGRVDEGFAVFDAMQDNDTIQTYAQYNKGLALGFLGDYQGGVAVLDGDETGPLHLNNGSVIAHAQMLSQLGQNEKAIEVIDGFFLTGFSDPDIINLRNDLSNGKMVEFTQVSGPDYGLSEAFLTMAEALSRDEPSRVALFYARLSQVLRPTNVDAAIVAADILELQGQFELASTAYASVPETSSAYRTAQVGRAEAMRRAGDVEGATEVLEQLADMFPSDVDVLNSLGDIYRSEENYADAHDAYTRTIENLGPPAAGHWIVFYMRGISNERLDDWPAAEADFRHALELFPDQPLVLNYLGYSLIEMNVKLDEAQQMIETAVAARPNDGYITDSLAWVLYRVGKFDQAVAPMEKSASLLPRDPIINDHLGDIYWMVGRKMEARFQWTRALSFEPEEVDAIRIKRKLEVGLDVVLEEEAED